MKLSLSWIKDFVNIPEDMIPTKWSDFDFWRPPFYETLFKMWGLE